MKEPTDPTQADEPVIVEPVEGEAEPEVKEPEDGEDSDLKGEKPEDGKEAKPEDKTPATAEVIADEPYSFEECQVQISYLLLPRKDGEPRQAICGVRTHLDDPVLVMMGADEILSALPAQVKGMLDQLQANFPARAMERMAKKTAAAKKKTAPAKTVVAANPTAAISIPTVAGPVAPVQQPDLFSLFK